MYNSIQILNITNNQLHLLIFCIRLVQLTKSRRMNSKNYGSYIAISLVSKPCHEQWNDTVIQFQWNAYIPVMLCKYIPSKNALARSFKKRSFFLVFLQDLVGYCKNLAGILLQDSCKIPQDLERSCRNARKKTFWKILQERFYCVCI